MVRWSVWVWQLVHPALLFSASSHVWRERVAGACARPRRPRAARARPATLTTSITATARRESRPSVIVPPALQYVSLSSTKPLKSFRLPAPQPGVDEARLALELARAQVGEQAPRRLQEDPGLGERDGRAAPEAERTTREVDPVLDAVEAARPLVEGVVVSRGPEGRGLQAEPVAVDRQLRRRHVSADVLGPAGQRLVAVVAE